MTGDQRYQHNHVGHRLRQLRHAQGKTLEVVAGLAGISPSHLCRLETGVSTLDRLSVIVALAQVLHIASSELISLQLASLAPVTVTA